MARIWDDVLPERDRAVYEAAGWGARGGYGERPAVLVVDINYDFVGDTREPILDSIKRYAMSCGEAGWDALPHVRRLLDEARAKHVPVFFTTSADRPGVQNGAWGWKNPRTERDSMSQESQNIGWHIPTEIEPLPNETVIRKHKPSAFFGTPLMAFLHPLQIDTLLVCGTTTSGCVRATVIDAFSYSFRVAVVEEGTFDRGELSHKVNLFDMNSKYADVVGIEDVVGYLRGLSDDLYGTRAVQRETAGIR